MFRKWKHILKRRVVGLVMLSMSAGMFLVLFVPTGIYILAAVMGIAGFYLLFIS